MGIRVLIKGMNKVVSFPAETKMEVIETSIKGNWANVEKMSGLPMDTASRMERAKYLGFDPVALSTAGAVGVGAMGVSEESEASFLGQLAKFAPLDMLDTAKKMVREGVDKDDIWRKTGWGKGADDKWRFEVDDSRAMTKGLDESTATNPSYSDWFDESQARDRGVPIEQGFSNDELLSQYPHLKSTRIKGEEGGSGVLGSFSEADNTVYIKDPYSYRKDQPIEGVISHELQHAVQRKEGFAKGGSSSEFIDDYSRNVNNKDYYYSQATDARLAARKTPEYKKIQAEIEKAIGEVDKDKLKLLVPKRRKLEDDAARPFDLEVAALSEKTKLDPFEQYKALAGEVEARNVETRLNMSEAERREATPWSTEDVPRDKQTLKGVAPSVAGAVGAGMLAGGSNKAEASTGERMIPDKVALDFYQAMEGSNIGTMTLGDFKGALDVVASLGSGLVGMSVGGITGILTGGDVGAMDAVSEGFQRDLATEEGKKALTKLTKLLGPLESVHKFLVDISGEKAGKFAKKADPRLVAPVTEGVRALVDILSPI